MTPELELVHTETDDTEIVVTAASTDIQPRATRGIPPISSKQLGLQARLAAAAFSEGTRIPIVQALSAYVRDESGTRLEAEQLVLAFCHAVGREWTQDLCPVVGTVFARSMSVPDPLVTFAQLGIVVTPLRVGIPYQWRGGWTFRWVRIKNEWREVPVADFEMEIRRDIVVETDGHEERFYDTEFPFSSGRRSAARLPAEALENPRNLASTLAQVLGSNAGVQPREHGHVMPAAKELSRPKRRREVGRTGFLVVGRARVYVMPNGIIGDANGIDISLHYDVHRDGPLINQYQVPLRPDLSRLGDAISAYFECLDTSPSPITTDTLASFVVGAPLVSMLATRSRAALYLLGETGTYKSTVTQLSQSVFGVFPAQAPLSFTSTVNAIEDAAKLVGDAPILVDDLKEGGTPQRDVVRMLQGYSAGQPRRRYDMKTNANRPGAVIRGALIITGETQLEGQSSAEARLIRLEVHRGQITTSFLDKWQARADLFPEIGSWWLNYLVENYEEVKKSANARFDALRRLILESLPSSSHPRVAESYAMLSVGMSEFLAALGANGLLSPEQIKVHNERLLKQTLVLAARQAYVVQEEAPSVVFFEILNAELATRSDLRLYAFPESEKGTSLGETKEDGTVWLYASVAYRVVKEALRRSDRSLHFRTGDIWRDAYSRGLLLQPETTCRHSNGGNVRVLIVAPGVVYIPKK